MTRLPPERWRRIDALYVAALDAAPDARDAVIRDGAAGDADLERDVHALLEDAGPDGGLLDARVAEVQGWLAEMVEAPDHGRGGSAMAGARIGPYRIREEIARGGMGAVFLAERADEQYEQEVALKLVKRGMDTDEILRRFRHERQILASLQHPHIARLLDGGATEDGQPYLVMEYIRGLPIDRYCDERSLDVDERLALFDAACGAVQHAHENLVVHLDLKPSNILVTEDGTPRLLDFGIARLLEPGAGATPVTRGGLRPMTPEYASPEQLRGAPVSVASDVYALGVVLYRLLTGRSPHRDGRAAGVGAEAAVERPSAVVLREPDGQPPATAVAAARQTTPDRLRRRLRGDLDSIVLRALDPDPACRYGSVERLRADLARHREGHPVEARSATFRYRAGKFLRRHARAAAAGAVAAVLLVLFTVAVILQQRNTARERDRAERERDRAAEVAAFMESLYAASDPLRPATEPAGSLQVRDFLSRGADRVQQELGGQPLVQAQLLATIGRVYRNMGLDAEARPLLDQALELRRSVHGDRHPDVGESLASLGSLNLTQGRYDEAQQLFEEALAIGVAAFGSGHPAVAADLNRLAILLRERGAYDDAERRHREALETMRRAGEGRGTKAAGMLHDLVVTLERKGDREEAERHARESVALHRELYGDAHPELGQALRQLGLLLYRRADYDGAAEHFESALAIAKTMLGDSHPRVADLLNRIASTRARMGDLEAAEAMHRESLALKRVLFGDVHIEVAYSLNNLASVVRDRGRLADAEGLHRESVDIMRLVLGEGHAQYAIHAANHATTLLAQGRCGEAVPVFRQAIATMQRTIPSDRYRIGSQKRWLGACLTTLGRFVEAEAVLQRSYAMLHEELGDRDHYTRDALARLVALYGAWGQPERAADYQTRLSGVPPR
jgi:eukaryotic-like serine/threonine-protein kinase